MRLKMRDLPSRVLRMPVLQQSVLGHRRETNRGYGCQADLAFESKLLRFSAPATDVKGFKRLPESDREWIAKIYRPNCLNLSFQRKRPKIKQFGR
ncbi:MAG: hypothetical protein ACLQU1_28610 [Bryobacteraceae bacterium]